MLSSCRQSEHDSGVMLIDFLRGKDRLQYGFSATEPGKAIDEITQSNSLSTEEKLLIVSTIARFIDTQLKHARFET